MAFHSLHRRSRSITPALGWGALLAPWLAGGTAVLGQSSTTLPGQSQSSAAAAHPQSYALDLHIDPTARQLAGRVRLQAQVTQPGDILHFELEPTMVVREVRWQELPVPFEHRAAQLLVRPPALPGLIAGTGFEVVIDYRGSPRIAVDPPWRGGFVWSQSSDGQPWFANVGIGDAGGGWWPCLACPAQLAQFDLRVTVPRGLVVASSGILQGEPSDEGATQTWHWRTATPLVPAQLALQVGAYERLHHEFTNTAGQVVPVAWFVLPEHARLARQRLPQFLDHLRVFEQLFGAYPFAGEKYGLAEVPYPGSSHPNLIGYGGHWQDDQFDALHNGLLARSWWGQQLVVARWGDLWLQEGFAAYAQLLFREARFGALASLQELRRWRTIDRAPLRPADATSGAAMRRREGGIAELASKGARILHTLRWHLGDERFFALLLAWSQRGAPAGDAGQRRLVTTEDFAAHCREFTGEDLAWFFAAYLHQAALPVLTAARRGGVLHLTWQADVPAEHGAFALAVPVRLGSERHVVPMAGGRGELAVGDREYLIDPDQLLLAVRGTGVR